MNQSDGILREDANDVHLHILLLEVVLVAGDDQEQTHEGEEDVEHVANLATLLPGADLSWVSLLAQVVNTSVKPVTVAINMELLEVSELVQRVVLQVVSHNLVLFCGLWLVLESVGSHDTR